MAAVQTTYSHFNVCFKSSDSAWVERVTSKCNPKQQKILYVFQIPFFPLMQYAQIHQL